MVRINLLPIREILRKREFTQFLITAGVILVAGIAIMGVTYLYISTEIGRLNREKVANESKLKQLQEKNKEITDLKNEIARLKKQVDTIEKLTQTRDTPAPFLGALALAIPDEVWVKTLNKNGKNFSIDGQGVDNTVVVNFVQRLQSVRKDFTQKNPWINPSDPKDPPFFASVNLVQVVRGGGGAAGAGQMTFKIVGTLR